MPGIAKESIVPNSKARLPAKSWRTSSQAVRRPMAAVSGAETSAIQIVVQNEDQAEPRQCRPCSVQAMPKALT